MTEATPRATVCPDCHSLVPANADDRRKHREWHADIAAKHRGVQKRLGELADTTSRTAGGLSDLRRDVDNTEIPEPVEPMRIEEWPEDEIDDPEDDDDQPVSTYADDDLDYPDTRADATTAFTNSGFTAPTGIA